MLKIKEFMKAKKSRRIYIPIIFLIVGFLIFYQVFISKGASYNWIQSDWVGGANTEAVATHTSNQTGWTKFFSKDTNVDTTTTPGEITLTNSITEDENTLDADFAAAEQTTALNASGDFYINGDSIQLKKQDGISCTVAEECIGGGCSANLCYEPWFCGDTVQDIQANTYTTVQIGTQCWLGENMRTTQYPDGSAITKGSATHRDAIWATDLGYYSCPPDAANTAEDCSAATTLGMLYQWSAAMKNSTTPGTQGICPTDWHLPTDTEFKTLVESQATSGCESGTGWQCDPAGSKLAGNVADQNWTSGTLTTTTGFDTSGFSAPASGSRVTNGSYGNRSSSALFWSSSGSGTNAWRRFLYYHNSAVYRSEVGKAYGCSVRCVKD